MPPRRLLRYPTSSSVTELLHCSLAQAVEALYGSQHEAQRSTFAAFYSSELGGIVTDPALMVVQIDDHMLHRGHGGGYGLREGVA